jgi:hypothetical protein
VKCAAPPIGTWLAKPIEVPAGAVVIGVDGGAVVLGVDDFGAVLVGTEPEAVGAPPGLNVTL